MDELKNEEMTQEVNELATVDQENEVPAVVTDEMEDSGEAAKIIAGGIAVIGLAAYGAYELGKNVVVPGVKKGFGWIRSKFSKNVNDFDEDYDDDFDDEEYIDEEPEKVQESNEKEAK